MSPSGARRSLPNSAGRLRSLSRIWVGVLPGHNALTPTVAADREFPVQALRERQPANWSVSQEKTTSCHTICPMPSQCPPAPSAWVNPWNSFSHRRASKSV